jgi:putative hemolysin
MFRRTLLTFVGLLGLLLAACTPAPASPTPEANLPNPASVYCEANGGRLEFRTDDAGNVAGICVFPNGSECDEWAYYRGECGPAQATLTPAAAPTDFPTAAPTAPPAAPTGVPTPLPIDPAGYQGWWTYTHALYGFSILLPSDWVADETTTGDPLMNGHLLWLHPQQNTAGDLRLRMTFRRTGEEVLLWPTGVGEGEFIAQGTLDVAGLPAQRLLLVCPNGQIDSIWYHGETGPNVQRGDLEFGFILSHTGGHCQESASLAGKTLRVGEMIIASLSTP